MKLHQLMKTVKKPNKRLGRGIGSGRGKTSGRGTKGQKARGKVSAGFIGGTLPLYKKLPFKRGIGNSKKSAKLLPIKLSKLSGLKAGTEVDLQSLVENRIVSAKEVKKGIKIMADGELKVALTIKLPISASAAKEVERAGGKVVRV